MKIKVAALQTAICEDNIEVNMKKAAAAVEKAAAYGAELVVLPETWAYGFGPAVNRPEYYAEKTGGVLSSFLSQLAKNYHLYLVGGSVLIRVENRVYNRVLIYGPDGRLLGYYDKIHLYPAGKECRSFTSGDKLPLLSEKKYKFAVMTCYDLRFPELARCYGLKGAEIIVVPANFTDSVNKEFKYSKIHHWSVLLQARAIENFVYIVAANCAGTEQDNYFGHSMIIDPWGNVLAQAGSGEEIISAEIDLEFLQEARRQLPVFSGIRQDILQTLANIIKK